MDDRQQQLVAAAEALRTWVYAQRALWAQGYPQSLVQGQRQLAAANGAVISPSSALAVAEAPALETWPTSDFEPSASAPIADVVGSTIETTTTFFRASWKMLAGIAAVAIVVWGVRLAWPGMREKVSSNLPIKRAEKADASTKPAPGTGSTAAAAIVGAKPTGRLQVESSPVGAQVLVDGKDRGVTPLTVDGLSVGSHKLIVKGSDGSVQRTVAIAADETLQVSESIYSGWLHVTAPFEIKLSEGQKVITLDDSNQVLLPPGPHDVRFENRSFGLREVRHVDIRPGETTAVSLTTPMSKITITSSEPATVAIDGAPAGETPLADHPIPVGTRDITVTSASGEVRHQTITVRVPPSELEIDFSKQ